MPTFPRARNSVSYTVAAVLLLLLIYRIYYIIISRITHNTIINGIFNEYIIFSLSLRSLNAADSSPDHGTLQGMVGVAHDETQVLTRGRTTGKFRRA